MPMFGVVVLVCMTVMVAYAVIRTVVNNASPKISVEAKVILIDKRDSGSMSRRGGSFYINFSRVYYVTFTLQPEGGRKKFTIPVTGNESISVGNTGMLTIQGTRFISFVRGARKRNKKMN